MKTSPCLFPRLQPALTALALAALLAVPSSRLAFAQDASSADDPGESLVLSPFEVSTREDRGYVSTATRTYTPRFQGGVGGAYPTVPVTVIRQADSLVIEFALSNSADKQDQRNQELTDSVDLITKAIKAVPGLRFENREVQLSSGNRRLIIGKGGIVTSFANFAIFAELTPEVRHFERVKQVRNLVSSAKLVGATKVLDGPVALFVKRPNETRAELLAKIFADLEVVKKGLGPEAEVQVTGLSGPVQLRTCSESEVELWLDYSFAIKSVREIEARKAEKKS
ncbi:MAG TPA: hypothetical protein VG734_02310 [Lacunisphaera sp.]|nr:hypothetical protein [Lacunisphaera sp.]